MIKYFFNEALKALRDNLNMESKNLTAECTKKEKLTQDLKNIKNSIENIKNPIKKKSDAELKNYDSSNRPTTITSTASKKNVNSSCGKNDIIEKGADNEKMKKIEELKMKLRQKNSNIDELNQEIQQSKKEFALHQKELYLKNEELSNKFSDIYNIEIKLDKLKKNYKTMKEDEMKIFDNNS